MGRSKQYSLKVISYQNYNVVVDHISAVTNDTTIIIHINNHEWNIHGSINLLYLLVLNLKR